MRILLLLLLVGCGFDRRSDDFSCERPGDCTGGRTCLDGWCVFPGGAIDASPIDADPQRPDAGPADAAIDAAGCPDVCDRCEGTTCVIECNAADDCGGPIVCPAGLACFVECGGTDSCAGGVDCSQATACQVDCGVSGSCGGAITCGAGACHVDCTGDFSCGGGLNCGSSCRCDSSCTGIGSCSVPHDCPGPNQCRDGSGCTSDPSPCHSC